MKLLFVSNLFPDAGEPYRGLDNVTVLHHLRERGHEIRVLAPRPVLRRRAFTPRDKDDVLRPVFLPVPYVPKLGGLFNHRLMAAALRPALSCLRREEPWDLVLTSWLFPDGWAVAHAAGPGPLALIAQGSDVHVYLNSRLRREAILEACSGAGAVITRSESLAHLLAGAGVEAGRLRPIHNGVDTAVFHGGDAVEARRRLGLEATGSWLLSVGNLLPVKDPEFLLRAFARIASARPEVRLALAGRGPLRPVLEAQAAALGLTERVRFLGPLEAAMIGDWMRAADLLVMTSRNEGLPNVILEAQACGLPVVSTRVGGIHEVVDASWKGDLTMPGDLAAWSDAVLARLARPAERDRLAALGMARAWPEVAEVYENALNTALAQAARAAD